MKKVIRSVPDIEIFIIFAHETKHAALSHPSINVNQT
jgi:hypothetical protein